MTLDSEQHRAFLLEMFNSMNFPGKSLELAVAIKQAVLAAKVEESKATA